MGPLANADCGNVYKDELTTLNDRIKVSRTEFLTSIAGGAAIPAGITAAGITISTAGLASAPALAAVAGGYFAVLLLERRSFLRASEVIADAEAGNGALLRKLVRQVRRKIPNVTSDQVTQVILAGYNNGAFCGVNWLTGKVRPFGYLKVKNYVESELGN